MARASIIFLLILLILGAMPSHANAFELVPCGRAEQQPQKQGDSAPDAQCNFGHLIGALVRLINYLISVAAIVAMYQVLSRGWDLLTSLGNPEKIKKSREGISQAIVGFVIIILGFVFINLVINAIGHPDPNVTPDKYRRWWDPKCIYDITDITGCPR